MVLETKNGAVSEVTNHGATSQFAKDVILREKVRFNSYNQFWQHVQQPYEQI